MQDDHERHQVSAKTIPPRSPSQSTILVNTFFILFMATITHMISLFIYYDLRCVNFHSTAVGKRGFVY